MISESLLRFIESLSKEDKKTLSQKALKVSEESGELAKVILPFDNAEGTIHRFSDKNKILEEVSDVILTSISIAYSLGFNDEDIEEMLTKKSTKWQQIQIKESEVKYPIPFEIHVTVCLPETDINIWHPAKNNIEYFKDICQMLSVKPIVLDLEGLNENTMDVMTSSHFFGDNRGAYNECRRIASKLQFFEFNVVREKIETVPWHPAAPSENNHVKNMPENCYFESHIGVIIRDEIDKEELRDISNKFNAHLSRNFFKKNEDGSYINMVTLRKYDETYEKFLENHYDLLAFIQKRFEIEEKPIIEFAIYDTKISHDFVWLKQEQNEKSQKSC